MTTSCNSSVPTAADLKCDPTAWADLTIWLMQQACQNRTEMRTETILAAATSVTPDYTATPLTFLPTNVFYVVKRLDGVVSVHATDYEGTLSQIGGIEIFLTGTPALDSHEIQIMYVKNV